jgi:hypothetical protein
LNAGSQKAQLEDQKLNKSSKRLSRRRKKIASPIKDTKSGKPSQNDKEELIKAQTQKLKSSP